MKVIPELVAIVRFDWHTGVPGGECREDHVVPYGSTDRDGILALYGEAFSEAIRGRATAYTSCDNEESGHLEVERAGYRDDVRVAFKVEAALRFGDGNGPCFSLTPMELRKPRHS
jgi:hypothetical protein